MLPFSGESFDQYPTCLKYWTDQFQSFYVVLSDVIYRSQCPTVIRDRLEMAFSMSIFALNSQSVDIPLL